MLLCLWLKCYIVNVIIFVMKHAKCLLKETYFEKDVFKLKTEPILMCMCPLFHNKLKQLKYLWWHLTCSVDWVYQLRTLDSHYLFVCFSINIPIYKVGFKSATRLWDYFEPDIRTRVQYSSSNSSIKMHSRSKDPE